MATYLFYQGRLVVRRVDAGIEIPAELTEWAEWASFRSISVREITADGTPFLDSFETESGRVLLVDPASSLPVDAETVSLRSVLSMVAEDEVGPILKAGHLAEWRRTHQYCGACGSPNDIPADGRSARCPACRHHVFPRISPAVIVQVTRGDTILLGRAPRHPTGGYSVLAGFVDPGESLEDAVRREIKEESGLDLQSVEYFGSQPWPFPDSLMIAFRAEAGPGQPTAEDDELEDVAFFSADDLPAVPPPFSIARTLVDDFAQRHGRDPATLLDWSI